ncbi:hypothetical protein [Microbacterium yannicii]|uniref:hypothetical protein n=1 Tax=Microbacterium yannicii TaxID=671622 RepID=UPI0012F70ADC|nr:hypothetical protein [Microbacterium yannicii]
MDRANHRLFEVCSDIGRKWTAEGARAMGEIWFLLVVGVILVIEMVWTLRVVLRDDPGPRPHRDDYDTRRPQ